MIPVTLEIAVTLKVNPIAFLILEGFALKVGGAATLIGDPPNILIGSFAKLTFLQFVVYFTAICLICLAAAVVYYISWYKRDHLKAEVKDVERIISIWGRNTGPPIKSTVMSLGMLGFAIFLLVVPGVLHLEPEVE